MTTTILRTPDAWYVQDDRGAALIDTTATTTGELIADRAAIAAATSKAERVPVSELDLLSPVTTPCRVVAQMTNYRSHVADAGMDPETEPYWKATHDGRLLIQRCRPNGHYQLYPRWHCLRCRGAVEWVEASGRGTVYSFTPAGGHAEGD